MTNIVGLNKAEVNALTEFDVNTTRQQLRNEEFYLILEFLEQKFRTFKAYQDVDVLSNFSPEAIYVPIRVRSKNKLNNTGYRTLIDHAYDIVYETLAENDPNFRETVKKKFNSTILTLATDIPMPVDGTYLSGSLAKEVKPIMKKYLAIQRYFRRLQLLALKEKLPVVVSMKVSPPTYNGHKIMGHQTVGLGSIVIDFTPQCFVSLSKLGIKSENPTLDEIAETMGYSRRKPTLSMGCDLDKYGYTTFPGYAVSGVSSGLSKHLIEVVDSDEFSEEKLKSLIVSRLVLYLDEFKKILKTINRIKEITKFETLL